MKSLIQNQRIRVDGHNAGGINIEGVEPVHIHKEFRSGKYKKGSVEIYISGSKILYKNLRGELSASIKNEISSVLTKDRQKFRQFGDLVARALARWSGGEISLDEVRGNAEKIAMLFELGEDRKREFVTYVSGRITKYISVHEDSVGVEYSICQTNKTISAGQIVKKH